MDRATKKFKIAATTNIIIGVVTIIVGTACGVLSIISGATIISGKKELEI